VLVLQRATSSSNSSDRLSWLTILGFGQLAVPLAFAGLPIAVFVSKFYAEDLKIDIETVGFILLVARLADFLVDPVIGYASDRTTWRPTKPVPPKTVTSPRMLRPLNSSENAPG
jgi:Na+/melibiose symporter-like transporter